MLGVVRDVMCNFGPSAPLIACIVLENSAGFMGGLLALGAYTDPNGLDSERAQRDLKTGKVSVDTNHGKILFV